MDNLLKKYWFESESTLGIGVTAYDINDAKELILAEEYVMSLKPNLDSYIENIDIQKLDENHVIPNMGVVANRGIWFPNVG